MSITKNHQSPETIRAMACVARPDKEVTRIAELTEGMFNAAYRLDFSDGESSILKIAAATQDSLLSNEINLMQAEVNAMNIVRKHGLPFVARVQYADFSRTLCNAPWFLMEAIPGCSMNSCQANLSDEDRSRVLYETGCFQRRLTDIRSDSFGLLGDSRRFACLYDLIRFLLGNVLQDATARSIQLHVEPEAVLPLLERDRAYFDEVNAPSLVHWDMWEGNIFVQDGHLCGVIDWERAMWGEPLMDDRFRKHTRHSAFLSGFRLENFTTSQQRRLLWYDLFLYLTMITETSYRQYKEPDGMLNWLYQLVDETWQALHL